MREEFGPFLGGDLISEPIYVIAIAELYFVYVLCSYLILAYPF
jgi:hypothetical protein